MPFACNFILTFSLIISLMYIFTYILAFLAFKEYLPSYKFIIIHIILSLLVFCSSLYISQKLLDSFYKYYKVNNGIIMLNNNNEHIEVSIYANNRSIEYQLCGQKISINNNMQSFYNSLREEVVRCSNSDSYTIDVIKNPFKEWTKTISHSIIWHK